MKHLVKVSKLISHDRADEPGVTVHDASLEHSLVL